MVSTKFVFLKKIILLFDHSFKYSNYSQSNDCHKWNEEDGGRYVEVIGLINPEFVRKFIDMRAQYIDLIGDGGLLGDQPGESKN